MSTAAGLGRNHGVFPPEEEARNTDASLIGYVEKQRSRQRPPDSVGAGAK